MRGFLDSLLSPEPLPGGAMRGRREDKLPPFVAIFREMLKSEAWEKLGNAARVAYIHLKAKCVSRNPGEITLSYNEMERFMERRTFSRAIRELEEGGFISRTQRGGLYRRRNFFRLSENWRNHNSGGNNTTVESGKSDTVQRQALN